MSNSRLTQISVGSVFNIPISFTVLWLLIVTLVIAGLSQQELLETLISYTEPFALYDLSEPTSSRRYRLALSTLIATGLYGSLFLHELGHAYAAKRSNIAVQGITLWALGGVAKIQQLSRTEPKKEFSIAIGGPLVSATLGGLCVIGAFVSSVFSSPLAATYFHILGCLNGGILLVNIVPAFPLDGGRILRASLGNTTSYTVATTIATLSGQVIGLGIFSYFLYSQKLIISFLGIFIFWHSLGEQFRVGIFEPINVRDIPIINRLVQDSDPLSYSITTPAEEITIAHNTFAIPQDLPPDIETIKRIISQHNGTLSTEITEHTDYLVVASDEVQHYDTLAQKHNVKLISFQQLKESTTHQDPVPDQIQFQINSK